MREYLVYSGKDPRFKNKIYRIISEAFIPIEHIDDGARFGAEYGYFEIANLATQKIMFDYIPYKVMAFEDATSTEIELLKTIENMWGYYRSMIPGEDPENYNGAIFHVLDSGPLPLNIGEVFGNAESSFYYFQLASFTENIMPFSEEFDLTKMNFRAASPREINIFKSKWLWFENRYG
ncbi:hypothetical protein KNP65_03765 [Latilactobacillus curvatus]|uniref:hypothetical protein n=1 Tax=Latilactobacillus curvatus TaxID=28038 RepID=UPI002410E116|nr:hypothetical protein [Latilactobacillus curvatus]MDG2979055.1 hypothetical protein [Latilactobacillus curvatus]